ncbi:hypothetical protein AHAS_Ahas11G0149900 [Arachis hypogaea]
MAPKTGESSSRKRKEKAPASGLYDFTMFFSKTHKDHFNEIVSKKKVIFEVRFDLKSDGYSEIQYQILRQGWEALTNPVTEVDVLMVREFYAIAWVTFKDAQGVNPDPKNWLTTVRWVIMEFSPESVREALQLPPSKEDPHSYTQRANTDQRLN